VKDIDTATYDLSVKNPNKKDETELRSPKEIIVGIQKLDDEAGDILKGLSKILN
jgi:type I restriction enzyme M protein